ncbi:hypothetical protein L0V05_06570 [Tabrizicola sp. J26]|uniref:hypothetical protein n=1 Tax=Alitabrizicola rongguiensis TaxID=2909234 RepID=UPI001F22B4F2|nr:hypothetical protein [Tabrizicola rongguiensis]MCF1708477.1 hypothetical protein [Tabrizicola rongguiensis]
MTAAIALVLLIGISILSLCLPPAVALIMSARRLSSASDERRSVLRAAMYVSGAILVFNTALILFNPPELHGLDDGLSRLHAIGLVLSWLCLWGALAMAFLMRVRRRTYP